MSIREKGSLQVRHAFPAYRVFIFGVDVTEDVLNVDVGYNIGRAPNTCSITLANELDKYILTTNDFKALYDNDLRSEAISNKRRELLSTTINLDSVSSNLDVGVSEIDEAVFNRVKSINQEVKRKVLKAKLNVRIPDVEQPDIAGKFNGVNLRQYTGDAYRYPFQAEDPIFHANDPIRIFERDPFVPSRWYHTFSGWVSNFDDTVDENTTKILTIGGEGPTKILRYARITTNPGIIDAKAITQAEDVNFRSALSEAFRGLTLPELFFAVIFGNDPNNEGGKFQLVTSSTSNTQVKTTKISGVGKFKINGSVVIEYGTDRDDPFKSLGIPGVSISGKDALSKYQSLIDHEVKQTDLEELLGEDADGNIPPDSTLKLSNFQTSAKINPRTNEINTEETVKFIGENPDIYPVDGGRLIMLLPKSLSPEITKEALLRNIIESFALNTQFKSRMGILYDVIERIEFVFYESPKGDLICEFPLYDFDPEDFGTKEVPHYYYTPSKNSKEKKLSEHSTIKRGPFAGRFTVSKRNTYNFSKGITDEKVRTQITAPWYFLQGFTNQGSSIDVAPPAVVTLRHLVPLYWLRLEQVDPKGYISSKEAALLYIQIMLNKFNADAKNLGINVVPNLGLWLNRPIFFEPRNCIGVSMGLSHSLSWGMGGSMDTRLNLNYIRGWDGLLDDEGKAVYTPLGGQPSRPLDYKILLGIKTPSDGDAKLPVAPTKVLKK